MKKLACVLTAALLCVNAFAANLDLNNAVEAKMEKGAPVQKVVSNTIAPIFPFQGLVKTTKNSQIVKDGNCKVTFELYTAEKGGKALWSETQDIELKDGIIDTYIGKTSSMEKVPFDQQYYLAVKVNDESMSNRTPLASSAYSMFANRVSEDAIVGGNGVEVSKNKDGKLEIRSENVSGFNISENNKDSDFSLVDGSIILKTSSLNVPSINHSGQPKVQLFEGNDKYGFEILYDAEKNIFNLNRFNNSLTPIEALTVKRTNGYIGIGTSTPSEMLDVTGTTKSHLFACNAGTAENGTRHLEMQVDGKKVVALGLDNDPSGGNGNFKIFDYDDNGNWINTPFSITRTTGEIHIPYRLEIGYATSSGVDLSVDGKIECEELEVKLIGSGASRADYVFDENYQRMSLYDVEEFVKENKHLPGMKSAAEVAANGVNLAYEQNKVLEKVEELTLHLIDLKKENDALKAEVTSLKNR